MSRACSFCGEPRRGLDRLVVGHGGVAICGDCARLAVELSSASEEQPLDDLLLTGIDSLHTMDERHGGILGTIPGAAVAIRHGRVTWMGRQKDLPDRYFDYPAIDCEGRMVAPGFVDAHRHLPADEATDLSALTDRLTGELSAGLELGTTTAEVRTWGASGPEQEVTMLAAIHATGEALPVDVISTVVVGTEPPTRGSGYLRMLREVLIPTAARVASYLDVVVGGPIGREDALTVLEAGRRHGLRPRVHVDDADGLAVAVEVGAVSMDGMAGMEAAAGTVAEADSVMVGVPVASWLGGGPDPVAAMWDAGVVVALGTGCRRAGVASMPLAMAMAVHHGGLTAEQALWSATRGGALAVESPEKGRIAAGAPADLVVLEAAEVDDLVTTPGRDPVQRVVKGGIPLGA